MLLFLSTGNWHVKILGMGNCKGLFIYTKPLFTDTFLG